MTWEEAAAYVETKLDDWCAEAGVTRQIKDPSNIAFVRALLRSGKFKYDSIRVEVPATVSGRQD